LTIDSAKIDDDIDFYVLDGLSAYLIAPASNPIDRTWTHKGEGERQEYSNDRNHRQ